MRKLKSLFDNNRAWATSVTARDPHFFEKLAQQQTPEYLWIGCSDSRVPENKIVGLMPGTMFTHRNVANVVVHTDLNCLSAIHYAVGALEVKHIIVCGHYGCGGVKAALENERLGLIDNWLRHVQDACDKHEDFLASIADKEARLNRLCELNVIEQVMNVCRTTIVQDAWERGQELAVHGWVYALHDGLLRDMQLCVTQNAEIRSSYQVALAACRTRAGQERITHQTYE